MAFATVAIFLLAVSAVVGQTAKQPHIVWIIADDLGFNDVSFHGSPQIPTPNIDAIAREGVILGNYHAQPVCSPTRASFMSGRHVIHTGIYMPFPEATAYRLNLTYTLLPEYLQKLNYSTHLVGKWHLGQNVVKALPISRGFDTHYGYWAGAEDYYLHEDQGGYDFQDDVTGSLRTAFEANNTYSTDLFTQRAVQIIQSYDKTSGKPLFMYLAYQNVHWPLEAPAAYMNKFSSISNPLRRSIAAMASILDDAVGNVTAALKAQGMYDDTLLIFVSDNGGPTNGTEGTMSNNYPLRGGKNTLWEGGTRVVACVAGWGIEKTGYVSFEKMHATDWLPTLVTVASGGRDWTHYIPANEPAFQLGDGMNVWPMLHNGSASPRTWFLHEAHKPTDSDQVHGNALTVGDWKIVWVVLNPEPGWYPPPGQDPAQTPYTTKCGPIPHTIDATQCTTKFCLFNVTADPCETTDLADQHPDVVQSLNAELAKYQATAVPAVVPEGCNPVLDKHGAWQPCDA